MMMNSGASRSMSRDFPLLLFFFGVKGGVKEACHETSKDDNGTNKHVEGTGRLCLGMITMLINTWIQQKHNLKT